MLRSRLVKAVKAPDCCQDDGTGPAMTHSVAWFLTLPACLNNAELVVACLVNITLVVAAQEGGWSSMEVAQEAIKKEHICMHSFLSPCQL